PTLHGSLTAGSSPLLRQLQPLRPNLIPRRLELQIVVDLPATINSRPQSGLLELFDERESVPFAVAELAEAHHAGNEPVCEVPVAVGEPGHPQRESRVGQLSDLRVFPETVIQFHPSHLQPQRFHIVPHRLTMHTQHIRNLLRRHPSPKQQVQDPPTTQPPIPNRTRLLRLNSRSRKHFPRLLNPPDTTPHTRSFDAGLLHPAFRPNRTRITHRECSVNVGRVRGEEPFVVHSRPVTRRMFPPPPRLRCWELKPTTDVVYESATLIQLDVHASLHSSMNAATTSLKSSARNTTKGCDPSGTATKINGRKSPI